MLSNINRYVYLFNQGRSKLKLKSSEVEAEVSKLTSKVVSKVVTKVDNKAPKLKEKLKNLKHHYKDKEDNDVNIDDLQEMDIKDLSLEERAAYRDALNTAAMFSRCEEVEPSMLLQEDHLDRGDFIIARMVWDDDKEKYHDHWTFVLER